MTEVASLIVSAKFEGADKLKSDLNSIGNEAKKAENAAAQLSGAFTTLKTAMAAVAGSMIVREFVQISDEMSLMNSRLKKATDSMAEFTAQQKAMHAIARDTHADIKDTTDLYVKLAPALKDLGRNTDEINKVTSSFTKALQLGGASAEESAAAIKQFGQAMGSGALKGDEFNSIAEASPTLMRYFADGLGVPIGKLKELASQGKLTAEAVSGALLKMYDQISKDAAQMPVTVGKAFTDIKTEMSLLVAEFNEAAGATGGMSQGLETLADWIKDNRSDIVEFGLDVYRSFQLMGTAVIWLGLAVDNVFTAIPTAITLAIDTATTTLSNGLNSMITEAEEAYNSIASLWGGETRFERIDISTNISDGLMKHRKELDEQISLTQDAMKGLLKDIAEDTMASAAPKINEKFEGIRQSVKNTGTQATKTKEQISALNRALLEIAQSGMSEIEKKRDNVARKAQEWTALGVSPDKIAEYRKNELAKIDAEETKNKLAEQEKTKQEQIKATNEYLKLKDREFNLAKRQTELISDETARRIRLVEIEHSHAAEQYTAMLKKGEITENYYARAMASEEQLYQKQMFDASSWGQIMHSGLNSLESAMGNFFDYSSDRFMKFGDLAQDILGQIYRQIVRMMIIQPLINSVTSMLPGMSGEATPKHQALPAGGFASVLNATPAAQGGVFNSPDLHSYANSIVSKPTFFKFAKGGIPDIGVMGEKNGGSPEAIMPLTRASNGDLGVKAQVSSSLNNVKVEVINQTSEDVKVSNAAIRRNDGEWVISLVLNGVSKNVLGSRETLRGLLA
ncbi:tape measure protein [Campylobacter concisus]|uniref:tape measure protein n=1 Tax=Campylobacter concisus TaxID=199 RepID=UPI000D3B4F4C|nr:tape measure protein [Campylobacter concisus]QPH88799.1 phage tail tape measure protein [Campylobacter concisus]